MQTQLPAERALEELIRLSVMMVQVRDPEELLEQIVAQSISLIGARRGFIFTRAAPGEELVLRVGKTAEGVYLEEGTAKISRSVIRQVDESGEELAAADTDMDDHLASRKSIVDNDVRLVLCTPLSHANDKFGVLYLDSQISKAPFAPQHLRLLRSFAAHAGASLANARAYRALRDLNLNLEQEVARRTHELKESEERYALSARGANDGLWDWNLKTGKVYFSPRWKQILGFAEDEVGNRPDNWFERVHPEDLASLRAALDSHLLGEREHFEHEYRMYHKDGSSRWILSRGLAVSGTDGAKTRIAGSQTDITERKVRDPITGLPNLTSVMDRIEVALARAQRYGTPFALLSLHLDRFQLVNQSLGWLTGDRLLIEVSRRMRSCVRASDTVARPRAASFLVLLEGIKSASEAIRMAEIIQESLLDPIAIDGQELFTTASVGIALSSTGYTRAEDVVRDAETAKSRAQMRGNGKLELFDTQTKEKMLAVLRLETELRKAVDRGDFRAFYQPIVSAETGKICGFEALIRWFHPERGMISPGEFIPLAEETGLIIPIGHWMLETACRQIADWQRSFPEHRDLTIAVNISGKHFGEPALVNEIERVLRESNLRESTLKVEITESALVDAARAVTPQLSRLKELCVRLSIDDFGTGYSSLSYLKRFPVDTLKIDRSFVDGCDTDGDNLAITRTIITLAHNLGMDIVAEGVETAAQLAVLKRLGCEFAQGFYFSRPVPAEEAQRLLALNGQPLVAKAAV